MTPESNWINRLWAAVTEVSAAAVAIHYAAPWNGSASHPVRSKSGHRAR